MGFCKHFFAGRWPESALTKGHDCNKDNLNLKQMDALVLKQKTLEAILKKYGSLAVAFSGGVDSTFLLAVAKFVFADALRLLAVTVVSPLHHEKDMMFAETFARQNNIRHISLRSDEMMSEAFLRNPPDRCYICKKMVFRIIMEAAQQAGIETVAHGENVDDGRAYRPGMRAAEEMGIIAPLADAGLTKDDIRRLSRQMGLATWNQPASGCLATRIPYHSPITLEKLQMVASAEQVLEGLGFPISRVRHHGDLAKIEVPEEMLEKLLVPSVRRPLLEAFKQIGFRYVSLDLEGHQSGRLERSIHSLSDPV